MATSDSEDFESADEELKEDSKELLGNVTSDNTDVKKNEVEVEPISKDPKAFDLVAGDAKVEHITKSLEKVLCVKENLSGIEAIKGNLCPDVSKNKTSEPCDESKTPIEENIESEPGGWECEIDDLEADLINDTLESTCVNAEDDKLPVSSGKETVSDPFKSDFNPLLDKLSAASEKDDLSGGGGGWAPWGGWGSWGGGLLSTASESVTTLTSQVSQGFSSVLETGLGVPAPEDLAKAETEAAHAQEPASNNNPDSNAEQPKTDEAAVLFGLGRVITGVSSITKLVETAGNKVVYGGLGTLETIGKKTMEVLQEGDPGLRKKRALFSDKIVLSQVLREARDRAEEDSKILKDKEEARKAHFETLFDDYQGLIHLEALEMLSRQCSIKLQSVLLNTTAADLLLLQDTLGDVRQRCQLPEEEEEGTEGAAQDPAEMRAQLARAGHGLGVPVAGDRLAKRWDELQHWLSDCAGRQSSGDGPAPREIHQRAIAGLAQLTADAVEQFHKLAELLLVAEHRDAAEEARVLLRMTGVLSSEVTAVSISFSECLNWCSEHGEDPEVVNSYITNVFLEASNSSSYIQEAFQLLVPVLQVGAVTVTAS